MKKKRILCTFMALVAALVFGGCGNQKQEAAKETESGEDEFVYVERQGARLERR